MIIIEKLKQVINNNTVEKFVMILIILNLITFVLDTMRSFHAMFGDLVHSFEVVSIIIFTIEYICRVLTIDKLRDIFKPMMLIDLFAILW